MCGVGVVGLVCCLWLVGLVLAWSRAVTYEATERIVVPLGVGLDPWLDRARSVSVGSSYIRRSIYGPPLAGRALGRATRARSRGRD